MSHLLRGLTLSLLFAAAASAAGPADGTYTGPSTVTSGVESQCGKPFRATVKVTDNAFDYVWDRSAGISIHVIVAPDGKVSGSTALPKGNVLTASGTISGGKANVDLRSQGCGRHLDLKKG